MLNMYAKPIIPNKYWLVERNKQRVGTIRVNDVGHYVLSVDSEHCTYENVNDLVKENAIQFDEGTADDNKSTEVEHVVNGYPTACAPFNSAVDADTQLPVYSKTTSSKVLFCAGYYIIKFEKGWVRSFCPKLSTISENTFKGPFKTELEAKQILAHAKAN